MILMYIFDGRLMLYEKSIIRRRYPACTVSFVGRMVRRYHAIDHTAKTYGNHTVLQRLYDSALRFHLRAYL